MSEIFDDFINQIRQSNERSGMGHRCVVGIVNKERKWLFAHTVCHYLVNIPEGPPGLHRPIKGPPRDKIGDPRPSQEAPSNRRSTPPAQAAGHQMYRVGRNLRFMGFVNVISDLQGNGKLKFWPQTCCYETNSIFFLPTPHSAHYPVRQSPIPGAARHSPVTPTTQDNPYQDTPLHNPSVFSFVLKLESFLFGVSVFF